MNYATTTSVQSDSARRRMLSVRGEPLFVANWERAVFIHFEVNAEALQNEVPFDLDLYEGRAFVSLVAFSMRGMRFRFGGKLGEWICRPIATHDFLNVRTYVHHRGESGIFFLSEWLSNRLCVLLGPRIYGLPYHPGRMRYCHSTGTDGLCGEVEAVEGSFRYRGSAESGAAFRRCREGSLDEFLLERYTAFTAHRTRRRWFRIWHEPWLQTPVKLNLESRELIERRWLWFKEARCIGANYSAGAENVWMGWPHRISRRQKTGTGVLSANFELP